MPHLTVPGSGIDLCKQAKHNVRFYRMTVDSILQPRMIANQDNCRKAWHPTNFAQQLSRAEEPGHSPKPWMQIYTLPKTAKGAAASAPSPTSHSTPARAERCTPPKTATAPPRSPLSPRRGAGGTRPPWERIRGSTRPRAARGASSSRACRRPSSCRCGIAQGERERSRHRHRETAAEAEAETEKEEKRQRQRQSDEDKGHTQSRPATAGRARERSAASRSNQKAPTDVNPPFLLASPRLSLVRGGHRASARARWPRGSPLSRALGGPPA